MGHAINAIVFGTAVKDAILAEIPHARVTSLSKGLFLVPNTDALFDALREQYPNVEDANREIFWKLSGLLALVLERASIHGPIAYIETDYFGGAGTQAAAVWRDGRVLMSPAKARRGPINRALRHLGVRFTWPRDAFQAVGLHRYRTNDDWLAADESDV
jgi:hypothetical protein